MRKRYVVLGLSAVLALAIAVPAIGQSSDPTATTSASAKKIAKQAKKKAKKAIKIAKQARNTANQALAASDDLDVRVTNIEQAGAGGGVGPQGPQGPQGPVGPAGPAGTAGPSTVLTNELRTIQNYGDPRVTIATVDGFRWVANCEGGASSLLVENVSGGNNSVIENGGQETNFDQGDEHTVASTSVDGTLEESDQVLVYGTNGNTTHTGFGGVYDSPGAGFGGADCVVSLNLVAL